MYKTTVVAKCEKEDPYIRDRTQYFGPGGRGFESSLG